MYWLRVIHANIAIGYNENRSLGKEIVLIGWTIYTFLPFLLINNYW